MMIQSKKTNDKHLYIIKNGNPSSRKSNHVWGQVEQVLKLHAISYTLYETEYPGHAKEIAENVLKNTYTDTIIVALGGDGTLHEVINGAVSFPHAKVVCFPAGSGNDYVRGIQKSKKTEDIISLLHSEQKVSAIDLGAFVFEGKKRHFVNSIGVGFDASISKAVNESKWKSRFQALKLGKFIYLYFFLKNLFAFNTFSLEVEIDGEKRKMDDVWFLVVCNQPYFGGGIKISPNASINDGQLQALVVSKISSFMLLLLFSTILWGGHLKLKWVEVFNCKEISLSTDALVPIQADGEHIGFSNVSVKVAPDAVKILRNR
ncbi:diacylglycerol/lipid kinase family protein [Bacillus massilioanorexius]|nr:diacylglycerol kinase family protein [Bacillus massilioanorexius]